MNSYTRCRLITYFFNRSSSKDDDNVFEDGTSGSTTAAVMSVDAADLLRVKQEAAAVARTPSTASADIMRVKQLAREARQSRERSMSGNSVRSLGLGGGGPIHLGRFHPTVTDLEQGELYGMGGHAVAGVGGTPKRMSSNASDYHQQQEQHHHHHHHHHHHDGKTGPDHTTHDHVEYSERL